MHATSLKTHLSIVGIEFEFFDRSYPARILRELNFSSTNLKFLKKDDMCNPSWTSVFFICCNLVVIMKQMLCARIYVDCCRGNFTPAPLIDAIIVVRFIVIVVFIVGSYGQPNGLSSQIYKHLYPALNVHHAYVHIPRGERERAREAETFIYCINFFKSARFSVWK